MIIYQAIEYTSDIKIKKRFYLTEDEEALVIATADTKDQNDQGYSRSIIGREQNIIIKDLKDFGRSKDMKVKSLNKLQKVPLNAL